MGQAYFATRISENISKTPEGYLLCLAVPVARTGWQDYLGRELVTDGSLESGKVYKVFRSEAEVFAPASLASYEGKSTTDGHPAEWLNTNNDAAYSKGHGQNARRGEGDESQAAVCDLIFKDAVLISKIENGLREVSCGYNCEYVPQSDGTFLQTNIRVNHIAVVGTGRAGDRIAIKDELPEQLKKGGFSTMTANQRIKHIMALGLKAFAKDAEPADVAATMEAMKEGGKDDDRGDWNHDEEAKKAAAAKIVADKAAKDAEESAASEAAEASAITALADRLTKIEATLAQLVKTDEEAHEESTSLDALESELTKPAGDCAAKDADAKAAEEKAAKDAESAKIIEPEKQIGDAELEKKEDAKGADTNAAILAGIRAMKPVIAAIADPVERKRATDSLTAAFRAQVAAKTEDKATTYAKLGTAKKASDEQIKTQAVRDLEYGRQLKEKRHRQM